METTLRLENLEMEMKYLQWKRGLALEITSEDGKVTLEGERSEVYRLWRELGTLLVEEGRI